MYADYRQFSWFTCTKLGKNVRRIIPPCAVLKIRKSFPSPDGKYVSFDGNDDGIPEIEGTKKIVKDKNNNYDKLIRKI